MAFTFVSKYGSYENCEFVVDRYRSNGNLAIHIISPMEGPICNVTVNTDIKLSDDMIAVKDYSENEGMVEFLKREGLIDKRPDVLIPSGWVQIPIYHLTERGKQTFGIIDEDISYQGEARNDQN